MCFDNVDKQSIYDQRQKIKSIIINMLQKLSHKYSSHNSNIKCGNSTIKCRSFELIHYAINLDVVSSYIIFSNFDYMFLSIYCEFESIKLFFS